jgi:RimJ/RimL family protein N-acetyltransferase
MIPTSIPHIMTARLLLREPRLDDFEAFAANAADPLARTHIGGPLARRDAWRTFLALAGTWLLQQKGWWTIDLPGTGTIGEVGVFRRETGPEPEIGWALHRAHWGRGYAREAAQAALDHAVRVQGARRVIAFVGVNNAPSAGVAECIGMRRETELDFYGSRHWRFAFGEAAPEYASG